MKFLIVSFGLIVSLGGFRAAAFECWEGTQKGKGQRFIKENFKAVKRRGLNRPFYF